MAGRDDLIAKAAQDMKELAEDITEWTLEGPPPRWKYADWAVTAEAIAQHLEANA